MSSTLTKNDYVKILNYYKMPIPKSYKILKNQAEKVLAEKLCRCIKSVDINDEKKSIGICTRNIFKNKGLSRGSFKCKTHQSVSIKKYKNTKKTTKKTKKNRRTNNN